jgi:hypothetical protein
MDDRIDTDAPSALPELAAIDGIPIAEQLQAAPTDRALVRVQQVAPQGVQAVSFIELPSNLAPIGLVGQVAGRVDRGSPYR